MSHTVQDIIVTKDFTIELGCLKSNTGNTIYLPDHTTELVGNNVPIVLYNKTIDCGMNTIQNINNVCIGSNAAINASKIADGSINNTEFQCLAGVTTLVAGTDDVQTLTNKTVDSDLNTLSNIVNGNIKAGAAINTTKLGDGSVSNTEFGYLNGLTSSIQTQLDTKSSSTHTHAAVDVTDFNGAVDSRITAQKATANGLATLNGSGKIPTSQLALTNVEYKGSWNASTNSPTIISGVGTQGHYYTVGNAGNTNIDGITDWQTTDWIIFNGTVWEKGDHTDQVTSVAGKQGAVTLEAADVASGTFANGRISESSVTQHEGAININSLLNSPTSTVVGTTDSQTLTNKTLDVDLNSLSNIINGNIKVGAAIDAAKIHDGTVSNTEFGYLNGVTSAIQTQINSKASSSHTHAASDITSGTFADARISQSSVTQHEAAINIQNLSGAPTGIVVGHTDTQTFTNKTIDADLNSLSNIINGNIKVGAAINAAKIHDGTVSNTEFGYLNGVTSAIQTQINNKASSSHTHTAADTTSGTFVDARISQSSVTQHEAVINIQNLSGAPTGTVVGHTDTQIFTNKTIDADLNSLSNIINGNIKVGAAINAAKIHDGTVSNTEFGYLNGVTSAIQTQINNKASSSHTHTAADTTSGTFVDARISQSSVTQHEGAINHDATLNFVANKHIDHSTVNVTAGVGLSGGGNIAATRTLDLDINSLTADGSPDKDADYVVTYDASAGSHKKVLLDNLPGSSAVVNTITTSDATNTTIATIATSTDMTYSLDIQILSKRTDSGSESATYFIHALFRNNGGTLTKVSDDILSIEDVPQWSSSVIVSGTNILVKVLGQSSKTIDWKSSYTLVTV